MFFTYKRDSLENKVRDTISNHDKRRVRPRGKSLCLFNDKGNFDLGLKETTLVTPRLPSP